MIDEILHTTEEVEQCRRNCDAIIYHLSIKIDNRWRLFMLADLLTKTGLLPAFEAESWENKAFRTLLRIEARNPLILTRFGVAGDNEEPQATLRKHAPVTILFIAGDRGGSQRHQIQIPREFHSITDALQASKHREFFTTEPILAATHQKLAVAYRNRPAILHFAGHGDDRSLSLLVDQEVLVSTAPIVDEKLAEILLNFPHRVRLCVLNTCESATVAKHLVDAHAVDAAIGWPGKLADAKAINFCSTFYGAMGDGLTLEASVKLAAGSTTSGEAPILFVAQAGVSAIVYA